MDTHLPSNPRYPDGKCFTGLHFLKTPAKPGNLLICLFVYIFAFITFVQLF